MTAVVDRFYFVKLVDDEVPARAAIAARVRAELGAVAGVDRVTVGVPADTSAARWDLSIVIRADDLAAWQRLAADPRLIALLDDWLAAKAAVIKAWTFSIAG